MTRIIKYNSTTIKCSFLLYQLVFSYIILNITYKINKGIIMKSRSFGIGVVLLSLVVSGLIVLTSCAKKETKACRLLSPDSLSTEEIEYIKSRDLIDEDEKIIHNSNPDVSSILDMCCEN